MCIILLHGCPLKRLNRPVTPAQKYSEPDFLIDRVTIHFEMCKWAKNSYHSKEEEGTVTYSIRMSVIQQQAYHLVEGSQCSHRTECHFLLLTGTVSIFVRPFHVNLQ